VNGNQNALKTALKQWQHLRNALAHPKPFTQKVLEQSPTKCEWSWDSGVTSRCPGNATTTKAN